METVTDSKQLIDQLRKTIAAYLQTKGELEKGETISLRVVIQSGSAPRKTILLDDGLGTFRLSGMVVYDRELSDEELSKIGALNWQGWQRGVAGHFVHNNNSVLPESQIRTLAEEHGIPRQRSGELPWSSQILLQMNKSLKSFDAPFRLV